MTIQSQKKLEDFEKRKEGTYGDFIKTTGARVKSDAQIRKYINQTLKDHPEFKLVKYDKGIPGTLDYGRAVIMFAHPPYEYAKKLAEIRQRKSNDTLWVIRVDYGMLSMAVGKVHYEIDSYKQRTAAERKYSEYVRWFLGKR